MQKAPVRFACRLQFLLLLVKQAEAVVELGHVGGGVLLGLQRLPVMANRIVLVSLKGISLGERPRVDAVVSSACNKHGLFKRRDGLLVMSTSAVEHSDYKQVVGVLLRRLAARLGQPFAHPPTLSNPSHSA